MFTNGLFRIGRRQKSTHRTLVTIYHTFSHGAAFYTLNGKNVNMLEFKLKFETISLNQCFSFLHFS